MYGMGSVVHEIESLFLLKCSIASSLVDDSGLLAVLKHCRGLVPSKIIKCLVSPLWLAAIDGPPLPVPSRTYFTSLLFLLAQIDNFSLKIYILLFQLLTIYSPDNGSDYYSR
jgi:hypothetical protein